MCDFKSLLQYYECLGVGAEIGVAEGRSSFDFLSYGLDCLYMVDAWQTLDQTGDGSFPQNWHDRNYADAVERVRPFGDKARILRGKSVEMAEKVKDGSLDFIYIDADHSFAGCLNDLTAWVPKCRYGSIIAGHDFLNEAYGVKKAVDTFCAMSGKNIVVHTIQEEDINNASFWFQKLF